MSLIICPDCYNQISERAPTCPYCGAPIATAQQSTQIARYAPPPPALPQARPPQPAPMMQPAQYQQYPQHSHHAAMPPQQPPIYHDPSATFVDPEEPFRNNSLRGAIKGQASFRATFLWWLVGFAVFGFLAFETGIGIAIIPAAIWFWGGIFLMFWNARNIYSRKLKTIVFVVLIVIIGALVIGASG